VTILIELLQLEKDWLKLFKNVKAILLHLSVVCVNNTKSEITAFSLILSRKIRLVSLESYLACAFFISNALANDFLKVAFVQLAIISTRLKMKSIIKN